jgi:hypothetical protein
VLLFYRYRVAVLFFEFAAKSVFLWLVAFFVPIMSSSFRKSQNCTVPG